MLENFSLAVDVRATAKFRGLQSVKGQDRNQDQDRGISPLHGALRIPLTRHRKNLYVAPDTVTHPDKKGIFVSISRTEPITLFRDYSGSYTRDNHHMFVHHDPSMISDNWYLLSMTSHQLFPSLIANSTADWSPASRTPKLHTLVGDYSAEAKLATEAQQSNGGTLRHCSIHSNLVDRWTTVYPANNY